MKYRACLKEIHREFIIEYDENVGYYLLVNCLKNSISIADHLCDSLEEAFFEAKDLYGIEKEQFNVSR